MPWPERSHLVGHKYRLDRVLILPVYNLVQRPQGKRQSGDAGQSGDAPVLAITPAAPGEPL